ncbi:MAG: riboflavin kinase [Candidatus Moranbacteria bacterium]|jgi:riboflavin kinase/FMN adenylyltransferase|nr:riboflavin kinase [Candidatus Moranbacteria bacterium]MDD5651884.1 riboflavin kinase [Candidatus Moranbacteria bacterium]MDX9855345.1 riboflavin kinase [Candidatus Moranbacteria bacterium]
MKIKGFVIGGKNKGEKIGFPTVNLELDEKVSKDVDPGVFSGKVFIDEEEKKAGIFINSDKKILEAHILDFSGDLRGREIEIEIDEKLRDVMKFENDEELIDQIGKDVEKVRDMK